MEERSIGRCIANTLCLQRDKRVATTNDVVERPIAPAPYVYLAFVELAVEMRCCFGVCC